MPKILIDLINKRFNMLLVIKEIERGKWGQRVFLCKCDCSNIIPVSYASLVSKNTKSCGCRKAQTCSNNFRKLNIDMGDTKTRLYHIWNGMRDRCYRPNSSGYKRYGARGIVICNEWSENFKAFKKWALANGYQDNLEIDRKNVNGNYEPSNCCWVTDIIQANNKRNTIYINHNGKMKTLRDICNETGLSRQLIDCRYQHGSRTYEALTKTPRSNYKPK